MSTIDPDARRRSLNLVLRPYALIACVLGILAGPVLAGLNWITGSQPDSAGTFIIVYVVISCGGWVFYYYVSRLTNGLAIAAYWVAYAAGLFLVLGSTSPLEDRADVNQSLLLSGLLYAVSIVLTVIYLLGVTAKGETQAHGIDTTATVQSAPVNGMVNYVQHQHLTLTFKDQEGVQRWFRIGRTGGDYSPGDKVPIRYDPKRPWLKRAIIVGY